jgi:hypothetical protein
MSRCATEMAGDGFGCLLHRGHDGACDNRFRRNATYMALRRELLGRPWTFPYQLDWDPGSLRGFGRRSTAERLKLAEANYRRLGAVYDEALGQCLASGPRVEVVQR